MAPQAAYFSSLMFERDIELNQHSHYRIGGKAEYFALIKNAEETLRAVEEAKKLGIPIFILGGGTNLLIHDNGIKGAVLKTGFQGLAAEEEQIKVGSGVLVKDILNFSVEHALSGLEWAGGLPGTIGGAIFGNAGAFGGEIKDTLVEVTSVDISAPKPRIIKRTNAECKFGYRNSIFKDHVFRGIQELIIEAVFSLKKGNQEEIRKAIEEKVRFRNEHHPMEYPNIGSIFKNIDWKTLPKEVQEQFAHKKKDDPFPVLPVAVLIDAAGLKGLTVGGAQVSEKHPNFIVNLGQATSEDVRQLSEAVKEEIKARFGVEAEREVIFL